MSIVKLNVGFDEIITHIYQGGLEKSPWQSFLRCLRLRINCDMVSMVLRTARPGTEALTFSNYRVPPEPEVLKRATADYAAIGYRDPLSETLNRTGGIFTLDQIVPRAELVRSEFYRRLLESYGFEYMVGMQFSEPDGTDGILYLLNGPDKNNFGSEEKEALLEIKPHLEKALKVYSSLMRSEIEKAVYEAALDRLTIGTIMLDGRGKVVEANRAAKNILASNPGIALVDGNIVLAKSQYREELARLIKTAIAWRAQQNPDAFVDAMRIETPLGSSIGILVRAAPVSPWCEPETSPCVILHIEDTAQEQRTPEQIVARLFGLTHSEALLATLLANGYSLAEAAAKLNLTEGSARTYSKKIFGKLGIGRQADLVRLILKSVASLAGAVPSAKKAAYGRALAS